MPSTLISFEVEDSEGDIVSLPLYFDATGADAVDTVAKANAAAAEWAKVLNFVTACRVGRATVTFDLGDKGGGKLVPTTAYTNDRGATISVRDSNTIGQSLYIPGYLLSEISSKVVSLDGENTVRLVAAIEEGEYHDGSDDVEIEHRLSSRGSGSLWTSVLKGKQTTRK